MVTASTLLHMKMKPESWTLQIDYIVAAICTILYTIDFFDLFINSIMFKTSYKSKEDQDKKRNDFQEIKEKKIGKIMEVYQVKKDQIRLNDSDEISEKGPTRTNLRENLNDVNIY